MVSARCPVSSTAAITPGNAGTGTNPFKNNLDMSAGGSAAASSSVVPVTATAVCTTGGLNGRLYVGAGPQVLRCTGNGTVASPFACAQVAGATVGTAISLQNGLAKNDALDRVFGPERVLGAACAVVAGRGDRDAAGRARHRHAANLERGELLRLEFGAHPVDDDDAGGREGDRDDAQERDGEPCAESARRDAVEASEETVQDPLRSPRSLLSANA